MKGRGRGRESNLLTQVLHFYIIQCSATPRWVSLNRSPSYQINLSKIKHGNGNTKLIEKLKNPGIKNGGLLININMDTKLNRIGYHIVPPQMTEPMGCFRINQSIYYPPPTSCLSERIENLNLCKSYNDSKNYTSSTCLMVSVFY